MALSLVQKHLPADCWKMLSKKTGYGSTIMDCCNCAFVNRDTNVGLYAQDVECYDLYKEIFFPLISEFHKLDINKFDFKHEFGNPADLPDMSDDLTNEILSIRVRVGRTIKGYPMAGKMTKTERLDLENLIKQALSKLTGELSGTYKSLCEMTQTERDNLELDHLLFADADDRFLESAGGYHDWPYGRGIFMNEARTFIVWVNEEDHIRIISMQQGCSLKQVYSRLIEAVNVLESLLNFEKHDKLGYLTFCPTNVGTALRASVHIRVPKLAESDKLFQILKELNLQPRGFYGEHTWPTEDGIYDISNRKRLGKTEWELINDMWNGIRDLLISERSCLLNKT